MNLAMVQVFIATNCKFNHYTFFGRAMPCWGLNDSLSFGKKVRWQTTLDDIEMIMLNQ